MGTTMRFAVVAFLCLVALSHAILDPNGVEYDETRLESESFGSPRGDDNVCGSAQMNFYWGGIDARGSGTPRIAEIFFYYNNTFHDNTYSYTGDWVNFGENGDNILSFEYPSAK